MSNNQIVIDTLLVKLQQLVAERDALIHRYNSEIEALEAAIAEYGGEKYKDAKNITLYDDENPNYIKQSPEEI